MIASLLNIEENINGNLAHMQITVDDLQQKNGQLNETITTLLGENHELSQRNLLLEEKIKCLTRHVRTMATSSVGTEKTLLQSVHDALLYLNNENSVITGLKSPELKESIKNLLNDYDPIDHLVSNSLSAK